MNVGARPSMLKGELVKVKVGATGPMALWPGGDVA